MFMKENHWLWGGAIVESVRQRGIIKPKGAHCVKTIKSYGSLERSSKRAYKKLNPPEAETFRLNYLSHGVPAPTRPTPLSASVLVSVPNGLEGLRWSASQGGNSTPMSPWAF